MIPPAPLSLSCYAGSRCSAWPRRWGELAEQSAPAFEAAVPTLAQLLKAEMAEREVRSIAYHTKAARFPAYKDLATFDFAASEANEATIWQLHQGEFTNRADNVVLIGGPGTGRTHVSIAVPDPRPRGRRVEHRYRDQTK